MFDREGYGFIEASELRLEIYCWKEKYQIVFREVLKCLPQVLEDEEIEEMLRLIKLFC